MDTITEKAETKRQVEVEKERRKQERE